MSPHSISFLVSSVLGLVLAIPSNTCIVMGNLDIIRKKGKLSPSDVIFLGKGIVNIPLRCVMSLQAMLFVLCPEILYIKQVVMIASILSYCLVYYNFWLTFWLSAHYCTSITNLSYGFFIWIKRTVSNFLSHLLFLTALGVFIVSVLANWAISEQSQIHTYENSTGDTIINAPYQVNIFYLVSANILGCILPSFLSLLCLVLTFSFLLRHVWRVKNNHSGSTRPNLQAHVAALRTISFLLLIFTFFCMSQVLLFLEKSSQLTDLLPTISWNLQLFSPWAEAAIIFQASNKLRRILLRRFWTRSRRNTET